MDQLIAVLPESAHLFYREGSSDKVYNILLQQCETGWSVIASWGRCGSTLQTDAKAERETYEKAKGLFDSVLKQKLARGYKFVEQAVEPEAHPTPVAARSLVNGPIVSREIHFAPELLTRITEREIPAFIASPRYGFQMKRDGRRLTICVEGEQVFGYNKLGMIVQLDPSLHAAIKKLCEAASVKRLLLDGEWEASGFWCWDCLVCNSDLRDVEYSIRHETAETLLGDLTAFGIADILHLVPLVTGAEAKRELLASAKARRAEGLAVKMLSARYCGGRNGNHFKMKFEATASVIVGPKLKKDNHRSVGMYVYDGARKRYLGSVKVADCYEVPPDGAVIEVRYLYLFQGQEGRLYQPVYFGVQRDDVLPEECVIQQLKLKQDDDDAAERKGPQPAIELIEQSEAM